MKDAIKNEKQSQSMLIDAFGEIGYGIEYKLESLIEQAQKINSDLIYTADDVKG